MRTACLVIALFGCVGASAQDLPDFYAYTPDTMALMRAGKGFFPSNLMKTPTVDCVEGTVERAAGGMDRIRYSNKVVNNYASLLEAQNQSVEAYAQSPTSNVHVSYASQRQLVSNSRNIS